MHIEFLFSYGTFQLDAVQIATFGRQLAGTSDALRGFELVSLKIEDQMVIAISGKAHHTMARFTGHASDVISGTVFAVTPGDIQNADKYEVAATFLDILATRIHQLKEQSNGRCENCCSLPSSKRLRDVRARLC